ncbi:E4 [Gammapapillomavirus 9]|uniref:E4 n=1 Tax=Gammapapillomavirus 9 TaxID=1175851 RepID=A0A2D2ALL0_9PAPI|nr:E4 [Gammapapillomavirus 9]
MLQMNKFPYPPTVPLGVLRLGSSSSPPPASSTNHRAPPGTPFPKRATDEERNKHRRKVLGKSYHPDYDENEEKENEAPEKEGNEEAKEPPQALSPIAQLLQKLEVAIDQLCDQVYHDLKDFKEKLGIH